MIWHLFPHLQAAGIKKIPELSIYGGIDSLEIGSQTSFDQHLITPREQIAATIRDRQYQYVVGNPPYIRAERLKVPTRWSTYYEEVATGKKDVAAYFLYRAIEGGHAATPWLEEGGKMGFIVPFSIADSKASLSLRSVLLRHHLLELVDLESLSNEVFTSGIATSRSTVAPILMIAGKSRVDNPDYKVKITTANRRSCLTQEKVIISKSEASNVSNKILRTQELIHSVSSRPSCLMAIFRCWRSFSQILLCINTRNSLRKRRPETGTQFRSECRPEQVVVRSSKSQVKEDF